LGASAIKLGSRITNRKPHHEETERERRRERFILGWGFLVLNFIRNFIGNFIKVPLLLPPPFRPLPCTIQVLSIYLISSALNVSSSPLHLCLSLAVLYPPPSSSSLSLPLPLSPSFPLRRGIGCAPPLRHEPPRSAPALVVQNPKVFFWILFKP
jgi:hypothetical protein